MWQFLIGFAATIILAVPIYILICGVLYIYEEIVAEVKKVKCFMRQGIWDLEWKWRIWKKGACNMDYEVINVNGHYQAYDLNGNFICSGDTKSETKKDAEEILAERR